MFYVDDNLSNSVRQIMAVVELIDSSTGATVDWFFPDDNLKSFTLERVGESKFFGYGYNQKVNVKVIYKGGARPVDVSTKHCLKIHMSSTDASALFNPFPLFYVSEVHRDENTGEYSITAYDGIRAAAAHTVAELNLPEPYSLEDFTQACARIIGCDYSVWYSGHAISPESVIYENGANFSGTETIREALDDIAEATQTIYYIHTSNVLVFRRLDRDGAPVHDLTKDRYFTLESGTNRRLGCIAAVTDLGDNVSVVSPLSGTTQYVRNNPFWTMRDDLGDWLTDAIAAVGDLTINQFDCSWRGNYLIELGDKIRLINKEGDIVDSFFLNDTLTYDGTLSQHTQWSYEDDEAESASNSNTLGETLKNTYARVNKADQRIEMLASEVAANEERVSSLTIDTNGILASVQSLTDDVADTNTELNEDIASLRQSVDAKMSAEDVVIQIQSEINSGGVSQVKTSTGFTFNDEGLMIEKTNSDVKTQITENGMKVLDGKNSDSELLVANNAGVKATNLHADTFLIMSGRSRFEKYGDNRIGCFWIGEI